MNYLMLPVERLQVLHNLEMDLLCKKHISFDREWKKEKKCKCVALVSRSTLLSCAHIKRAISKEFKEENKKLWAINLAIIAQLPRTAQLYQFWKKGVHK